MKLLSEKRAMERLSEIQAKFADLIRSKYEYRAKSCATCDTPGACCLDEHFVNVRISRLEARLIEKTLQMLPAGKQKEIYERVETSVAKYGLSEAGDTVVRTFACPLYERRTGCLVHNKAKPLPCINHACYERREDLPPDELLAAEELRVNELNFKTYGKNSPWLPLPAALLFNSSQPAAGNRHGNQQDKEDQVIPNGDVTPICSLDQYADHQEHNA